MSFRILILLSFAFTLYGQQIQLNLDHLAKKASRVENVNIDASTMKSAGSLLSVRDKSGQIMKMISGLQGICVRSFRFEKPGAFSDNDVDRVRRQLRGYGWTQIVGSNDEKAGKIEEVYLHSTDGRPDGLVVLDVKPTRFETVNIVGSLDPKALGAIGAEAQKQ